MRVGSGTVVYSCYRCVVGLWLVHTRLYPQQRGPTNAMVIHKKAGLSPLF